MAEREMSQKSPSSLEELEARCEALSRRVIERPARSPLRQHGNKPTDVAIIANPSSGTTVQQDQYQSMSSNAQLSPQDVAMAVASLEREKYRLEEQLKLVNLHLAAYHIVQQTTSHQPQPTVRRQLEAPQHEAVEVAYHRQSVAVMAPQLVPRYTPHTSESSAASPTLPPVRAEEHRQSSSPPRPPPSGSSQTEHIYEELRQIRKLREEREATRHAQLQAQSGIATGSYRPSTGQRY